MIRVSFDIACNLYRGPTDPWINTPEEAREYYREKQARFDAATVVNHETNEIVDVADAKDLFEILNGADEIISFNGRICDLIVMEHKLSRETVEALWRKPHHGLNGWKHCWSLKDAVRMLRPELFDRFEPIRRAREEELTALLVGDFLPSRFANTFRDALMTMKVFEAYIASGDTSHTYLDS